MNDGYVDVHTLRSQLASSNPPTLIDVRGDDEYAAGHIPAAWHIPGDELARRLAEIPRDRSVVAY